MQRKWIFLSIILLIAALHVLFLRYTPKGMIIITFDTISTITPNLSTTDGCIFPILDPWHESILDLVEKDGSIDCKQTAESGKKLFKMFTKRFKLIKNHLYSEKLHKSIFINKKLCMNLFDYCCVFGYPHV